ncbi:hypothetical protein L7F22_064154 [Adiantum nelumboides]|nr:hypothetical protein [Adiantum nelumboides]
MHVSIDVIGHYFSYTKGPSALRQWRLITLMSSLYKILARMITAQLRPFLPDLIHSSQTGFVQDCSILDNVVTFYEAVEWARQTKQPTAIMLLDIEKAYDRVDWGFLEGTLSRMGFPDDFKGFLHYIDQPLLESP